MNIYYLLLNISIIDQKKFDVREKEYERIKETSNTVSACSNKNKVNKLFLERLVGVELTIDPGE